MKLTTTTQISVDGVAQGNGGPDENRRGVFERGGWARPLFDSEAATFVEQVYQRADAFLFGRWTYDFFAGYWGAMAYPGRRPQSQTPARICHCSPIAGEELVFPPAEQERVGALADLLDERSGLAVEQPPGPSASLEYAAAVLRPARRFPCLCQLWRQFGFFFFHDRGSPSHWGALLVAASRPCYEHPRPLSTPRVGFLRGLAGTPVVSEPIARRFSGGQRQGRLPGHRGSRSAHDR